MTYRQLIQFDPIEDAVRLGDASRKAAAGRMVSTYLMSGEMAGRLTGLVFPHLQFDQPVDNRALLVVGQQGSGKSHLMAFVSSLAEHADLADAITNPDALTVDHAARSRGCAGVDAVAGRFKVIRTEMGSTAKPLRDILLGKIQEYLTSQGVTYSFPPAARSDRNKPAFDAMMDAFHQRFPEQGLLLVVDDLFEYLLTRKVQKLIQDLDFLRWVGDACRGLRFRFIAGVQESLLGNPRFNFAADSLSHLHRHFTEVVIGRLDVRFVIAERLVRKTPAQREQVEQYLTRFAKFFGTMNARMDEFVTLFPIHPDCMGIFEENDFAEKRGVLQILSDAVEKRLEESVPEDRPGLIAYDNYWETFCRNPARRAAHEIETVIDFSKTLEGRIEQSVMRPEYRDMARRIVHALSIHCLTRGDIYSGSGATPTELRDTLCLYQPGLEDLGGEPADSLLSHVVAVLGEIRKAGNETRVAVNVHPENNKYYLQFKKFKRFATPELVLHWVNAVPFLMLMLTGGIMLASRFFHMDRQLFTWTVILHKLCAVSWVCALPFTVMIRAKAHWAHIRPMLSWGPEDAVWMVQSLRILYDKKATVPPAGRFNTGQKINACLVMLYFLGFAATGLLMFWKGTILFPWYVHTALFFAAMGSVGGHLYLATINPSTRIALAGIFHGWAPMQYVEHHHPLSLPQSMRAHAEPVSLKTLAEEVLVSKVDLAILAVTVIMAGVGVFAFSQGRLATVKRHFAKNFADLIQPNELSTKHRMGLTAEACDKCHLYTGELPDGKCEHCHADIKERRAKLIGYHGNLKGDCRFCHREHQARSRSIVPLVKEQFDHKLASFTLEGKHAKLACDECHRKMRAPDSKSIYYIGLKHGACTDCHRDPHTGQFAAACEKCHSPNGWKDHDLTFTHEEGSKFGLLGKHATVACVKCHTPKTTLRTLGSATFKGLPTECNGCHKDPHRKQFDATCAACHSPEGWQGKALLFDHNRNSKFQLTAKHAEAACNKCHTPAAPGEPLGLARFRGLATACADCHKDPHKGQLGRDCAKCHTTPNAWKLSTLQFNHNKDSAFALRGKHASVECIQCHKPQMAGGALGSARFKGMGTGCEACHKVQHPESYGSICTSCHTLGAWPKKQPVFDHRRDTRYALVGKHPSVKCSACHNVSRMGVLDQAPKAEYNCYTCHKQDDPHKGTLGTGCAKCHTPAGWKGKDLIFDHNTMASYPLKLYHRKLECTRCHQNGRWKPVNASCDSCHPEGGKTP